jgi:hypothetical protein
VGQYANAITWAVDFTKLLAGTPAFTDIAEIVSVNFDGISADAIEDTVHGDTWRTRIGGLKDGGTGSITIRFGTETHASLLDNIGGKFANRFRFPKQTSSNAVAMDIKWDAVFTNMGIAAPHDGLLESTVQLTFSGAPTIVDEAAI